MDQRTPLRRQVFVHDLNLFVTVQLLEETPAVLSPGKLCEDHGYSYEWVSGQKPRLIKDGNSILCKTDNFVLRVDPGSGSVFVFYIAITGLVERGGRKSIQETVATCFRFIFKFSSWAKWRNGIQESGASTWKPKTKKKRDDRKDSNDPLADIPEWLISKKIWWIQNCLHPHTVLMNQIWNIPWKWQQNQGNTALKLTSQKTEIATSAWESKGQALLAGDALAKLYLEQKTERTLLKFLEPSHGPKVVYTDNSLELRKPCEYLSWNHRTSTPHRSETNGIAERAVRRVKECTSAVWLQSGLDERWPGSMECYCVLRNVQDFLTDGETPLEQWLNIIRFHRKVKQEIINLERNYYLVSFLGHESVSGWIWKGDILIVDIKELEKMDASEICPWRINAKEILIRQTNDEFLFPFADGTAKLPGRDYEGAKVSVENFKVNRESLNRQNQQMTLKARTDFWSIHGVTSSIVITMNHEFNSMSRRKKHSLFHWNTLMLLDPDVMQKKRIDDHWNFYSNRNLSDSWNLITEFTLLKEKIQRDKCGPGGDWQRFKRLPDQIMYGQKYSQKNDNAVQNREEQE